MSGDNGRVAVEPTEVLEPALCGAEQSLGSAHDDYPTEFTCDLPAGHDGWHHDRGDDDEYHWKP